MCEWPALNGRPLQVMWVLRGTLPDCSVVLRRRRSSLLELTICSDPSLKAGLLIAASLNASVHYSHSSPWRNAILTSTVYTVSPAIVETVNCRILNFSNFAPITVGRNMNMEIVEIRLGYCRNYANLQLPFSFCFR